MTANTLLYAPRIPLSTMQPTILFPELAEDNCFVDTDLLFLPLLEQDEGRPSQSRFKDLGQDQQEDKL